MSQPMPQDIPGAGGAASRRVGRDVFVILLALYVLILYPILRANRYYMDDLKRALIGHTGWDSNGRPLTTLLMKLLQCYDSALVDLSPLTQIGAVVVLAWAGAMIARRYAIRSPWVAALVAFPLGAQPFYLENLSYKFDALSMSMAMLLALLPLIALRDNRNGWWWGVLAIFASLCFYQAAINAYLIFVLLEVVLAQLHGEELRRWTRQLLARVGQVGLAMLVYQVLVGIHIHGWVKQKAERIHGLHDLPLIKDNIVDFYGFIGSSFNRHWWMYFAPVLVLLALFPVAIGLRYARRVRHAHPAWVGAMLFVTAFALPLAALLCVAGPMLVLLKPEIEPRVLVGVGALLAAALIVMQAALRQWHRSVRWVVAVAGMLALGMCAIASVYGNAMGEQKNYEERIAARLADDLAELGAAGPLRGYLLDGTVGYAPPVAHVVEQFPLVRALVPIYLSVDDMFASHNFLNYYVPELVDMRYRTDPVATQRMTAILAEACTAPVARRTRAYTLRLVDDTVVVTFGSVLAQCCADGTGADASLPRM
ncbi:MULTISPECIES: glucosyltransferase domain-containing protein [Rhodanobacter]|uniref:glucosyltransferase domain-containing protein n=1 Tax=Rhodanobacter TaxID=75309 RepID=UPI0004241A55|nr:MULTISPECIES: glucosyltransferase domain-containing protein [Rhodanobacter]UJJ53223.1 glucosyltransferase domain-containing protein [Rhodanobacter thiooxydans]